MLNCIDTHYIGYTGYVGDAAHKIWSAIYFENCFMIDSGDDNSQCYERKVFYKLISGMHSTISAHIAWNWPSNTIYNNQALVTQFNIFNSPIQHTMHLSDTNDITTAPNTDVYIDKLALYPERIDNLRFTYTVLLRAVNKATEQLLQYEYFTSNDSDDHTIKLLMNELLSNDVIQSCTSDVTFDERSMFTGDHSIELKNEFQQHFRNVSSIMDCVGCEKCRLHGKLQVLGIGTALRILFAQQSVLQRNEIMSLIVTLSKVADALYYVQQLQQLSNTTNSNNSNITQPIHNHSIALQLSTNNASAILQSQYSHSDLHSMNIAVSISMTLLGVIVTYIYVRTHENN